jgi:hypothetical protein
MESEFLARLSPHQRVFLTRTAVLERMCGPLCEAVLDQPGAAATLAGLARSNLLLVPLDAHGEWYRYHQLFRDMLLAELRRREPGLVPVLRRRAAGWCARNGLPEEALEYSIAAGDVDMAAALVGKLGVPAYRQGRVDAVLRWLGWLEDRGGTEGHPMVAVLAGLLSTAAGRAAEAERWADVVDHWQYEEASGPDDPAAEAWAAVLRAVLCQHGVKQMRADADEAACRFAAQSVWEPGAALMQGVARILHTAGSRTRQPRTPPIEDLLSVPALPPGRRVTSPHLVALPGPSVRFSGVPHPARKGFECTRHWHRRASSPAEVEAGRIHVCQRRPRIPRVHRRMAQGSGTPQEAGQRALISLRSVLVSAVAVVQPQSVARLPAGVSTTRGHLGVAPLLGFSNACHGFEQSGDCRPVHIGERHKGLVALFAQARRDRPLARLSSLAGHSSLTGHC